VTALVAENQRNRRFHGQFGSGQPTVWAGRDSARPGSARPDSVELGAGASAPSRKIDFRVPTRREICGEVPTDR